MASIFSAILRGEFRADSCARVLAIATLLGAGSMASAQSFVQLPNSGNTSVLNGTLLSTTVTISGATSNLQVAPSINPPYNAYDIWDNAPTPNTTGLTPAAIYPATARGNPQIVITSPGASTAASPYRVTVHFGKAVQDPVMLVYSMDNSAVDVSPTRTRSGSPAVTSITGNSAAAINATAQTIGANLVNNDIVLSEGCWNTTARACAVIRFSGSYNDIVFNLYSVPGGQDGVGFQFGAAELAPPPAVPSLSTATLGALMLMLLVAFAWVSRSRNAAR